MGKSGQAKTYCTCLSITLRAQLSFQVTALSLPRLSIFHTFKIKGKGEAVKSMNFTATKTRVEFATPPPPRCVTLGRVPVLAVSQLPYLKNKHKKNAYLIEFLWGPK